MAKKPDSGFIDSVPEMVQKVRGFKYLTMSNPALPFPGLERSGATGKGVPGCSW